MIIFAYLCIANKIIKNFKTQRNMAQGTYKETGSEFFEAHKNDILTDKQLTEHDDNVVLMSVQYSNSWSYEILLPEDDDCPMEIVYNTLVEDEDEDRWRLRNERVSLGDGDCYAYDKSQTLDWNVKEAIDWANDNIEEYCDM